MPTLLPSHRPSSRRGRRAPAAVVAAAVLLIAGCGGDDGATSPTTTTAGAATTATGRQATSAPTDATTPAGTPVPVEEGAFPVTIEHQHGSTTITEEPQRVVTLGLNDQDYVLAFGVQPVAAAYWNGAEDDATQVWTDGIVTTEPAVLNMPDGINFEAVAASEPDLIIGLFLDVDQATYDRLTAIAPTVVRGTAFADYGVPWQDTTLAVGTALGRPARAAEMVADLEARFDEAAAAHPSWQGQSLAVLDFYEDTIGVYRSDEPRPTFFVNLGFEVPAAVDELAGAETWGQVSLEEASSFDLDLLVWRVFETEGIETIASNPVLAALDVMERGDVVWMDLSSDVGYAYAWGTVLSLPFALDGVVPMLEAVVGG